MPQQLPQLLRAHKSLKPRTKPILRRRNHRKRILPAHIFRLGEQHGEQFVLAAHAGVDHAVRDAVAVATQIDHVDAGAGVVRGQEFDVAVHGFAGVAVHDDVDGGAHGGGDGFGVGAEIVFDEGFGEVVGDLGRKRSLA